VKKLVTFYELVSEELHKLSPDSAKGENGKHF